MAAEHALFRLNCIGMIRYTPVAILAVMVPDSDRGLNRLIASLRQTVCLRVYTVEKSSMVPKVAHIPCQNHEVNFRSRSEMIALGIPQPLNCSYLTNAFPQSSVVYALLPGTSKEAMENLQVEVRRAS